MKKESVMYKSILIPISPDHERDTKSAIALADSIRSEGGKITLLSVIEFIPPYIAQQLPDGLMTQNVVDAKVKLQEDADGLKNTNIEVVVGHPANSILDYAEKNGTDCIVVASHRPGYQDYFLGSTAARVVRHATCAVHVLR
jgi:nucleotide-binding universal stress UspA family protein